MSKVAAAATAAPAMRHVVKRGRLTATGLGCSLVGSTLVLTRPICTKVRKIWHCVPENRVLRQSGLTQRHDLFKMLDFSFQVPADTENVSILRDLQFICIMQFHALHAVCA